MKLCQNHGSITTECTLM